MALITLAELKAQLNMDASNTSHDVELAIYVAAAIEAIELARGEVIDPRAVTVRITATDANTLVLPYVPVTSVTSIETVDGETTYAPADFDVPASGTLTRIAGPVLVAGRIVVAYQAGYATPPARYKLAALIVAQHLWETQRGSVTGGGGAIGTEETFDPRQGYALPRRAQELLGAAIPGVA